MVAGSFFLTPATALRYERHDLRVSQLSKEDELGLGKDRRKVDINEEYYRLAAKVGLLQLDFYWEGNKSVGANANCLRIWMTGRIKEWKGSRVNQMAFYDVLQRCQNYQHTSQRPKPLVTSASFAKLFPPDF